MICSRENCGSFRPYLSQGCSVSQNDVTHIDNNSEGHDEDGVHAAQDDSKVAPVKCQGRAVLGTLWPGCCITINVLEFENILRTFRRKLSVGTHELKS